MFDKMTLRRLACFANGDLALVGLRLSRRFLGLAGGSLGQISLVPFSLCVGQVIPLIVVERQAKFTLITTNKIIKIRTTTSKSNQIKSRECDRRDLPRWLRIK